MCVGNVYQRPNACVCLCKAVMETEATIARWQKDFETNDAGLFSESKTGKSTSSILSENKMFREEAR